MKWFRINKNATPSTQTHYSGWKEELRAEAKHQCCYCTIHESTFGGHRNYAVEHLRPKAKYPRLELRYQNLFYACCVCNSFKGDDWPAKTLKPTVACYLDPTKHDYATQFAFSSPTGLVRGRSVAAKYIVERLHLNRMQLITYRRRHRAAERQKALNRYFIRVKDELDAKALRKVIATLNRFQEVNEKLRTAVPYGAGDLRAI